MSRETTRAATETGQGSIIPRSGDPSDPEISDGRVNTLCERCRCGGRGEIREGHYPTWAEIICDTCERIEFGRDEASAIRKWNGGDSVLLCTGNKANDGPRCGNSNEPSNPGTSDQEGQRG